MKKLFTTYFLVTLCKVAFSQSPPVFIISDTGNMGIGSSDPTEKLDINGTARLRGLLQSDTSARVLVSDLNGKLYWRNESTFSGTENQTLSLSGFDLSISNGNTVDLSSLGGGSSLLINNNGSQNIFVGEGSGEANTTGFGNSAIGYHSLQSNTTGSFNSANGYNSLENNTTGRDNTASGVGSLNKNTTGILNTASGSFSLYSNTVGNSNTAYGARSLYDNTSGITNTAIGYSSLSSNSTGDANTAIGSGSLNRNNTGNYNTAIGVTTLSANTSGSNNTAIGFLSLNKNSTGMMNVAIGAFSQRNNSIGQQNTAIGSYSGTSTSNLNNTTALGYQATVTASNQVRIGNSSVTDIGGQVSWSTLSDGRFKKDLKADVAGLSFVNVLKPVSYQVDMDKLNTHLGLPDSIQSQMKSLNAGSAMNRVSQGREIGFVAQDVEKAMIETGFQFNGVHVPENEQDHYTIRYAEFVVPLVKAVQELSALVESQQKQIRDLSQLVKGSSVKDELQEVENNELINGEGVTLFQNNPNPFDQSTAIKMELPEYVKQVDLRIYNLEGKQIDHRPITDRGQVSISIIGKSLDAGMYIYALIVDGKVIDQKRMILTQ